MGRVHGRSKPVVTNRKLEIKKLNKIPTKFDCLKCNEEGSIVCKIDKKSRLGMLSCEACEVTYSCKISALDEEIDVYTIWKDERESGATIHGDEDHSDEEEDLYD